MKRFLILSLCLLASVAARADIRSIDITVFGMD